MSRLRHPVATAKGLGSAKDGVNHWWLQRVTAIALALLTPWFIITVVGLIGADYAAVKAAFASPLTASLMLAFVLTLFWHARLGLQVVIEDYIHAPALELVLQLLVKFVYALAALASTLAIGRLLFSP